MRNPLLLEPLELVAHDPTHDAQTALNYEPLEHEPLDYEPEFADATFDPALPQWRGAAEEMAQDAQELELLALGAKGGKSPGILGRIAQVLAPLYGTIYDAQMRFKGVRLVRHRVQLTNFPNGAAPLRAVFMSDLHYGPASGRLAARQAWTMAREAEPDVLFLGGDYLWADERGLPALMRELQRWKRNPPPGGMYAVLGNHDHRANVETVTTCLEACGVRVLLNDAVELPAPWRDVWVVGTDEVRGGDAQPELALASVPRGAASIMLSHSPDICEFAPTTKCGLTLCGGTHGGQICPPSGDPIYMPSKWGKQYHAGLFRHAGNWVFVSRGVGVVNLPIRLFAPPDIGVFEIVGRSLTRR